MTNSHEQDFSYTAALKAAERDLPVLVHLLSRAHAHTVVRIPSALSGTACSLRALEEILKLHHGTEIYFRSSRAASMEPSCCVACMVRFASAIEALLSGFPNTVLDSTRDVMEIEFLFATSRCTMAISVSGLRPRRSSAATSFKLALFGSATQYRWAKPRAICGKLPTTEVTACCSMSYRTRIPLCATPSEARDAIGSLCVPL